MEMKVLLVNMAAVMALAGLLLFPAALAIAQTGLLAVTSYIVSYV